MTEIAVIGAGYVGLVTAATFAAQGHTVHVADRDTNRIDQMRDGILPFYEQDLTLDGLYFYKDNQAAVDFADVVFICLPTPTTADGSADLTYIEDCLLGLSFDDHIVVIKSTVPPGTTDRLASFVDYATVVSSPEFLREGTAMRDARHPDRIVIGARNREVGKQVALLYPIHKVLITDPISAELIKYASNAYLATRLTYVNSIAHLAELLDADAQVVMKGMGMDQRIGPAFLRPGPGYGGSCFPKDTDALVSVARDAGFDFSLLRETIRVNNLTAHWVADKVPRSAERVAMWGLTFKADTDDLRESPALKIAQILLDRGHTVHAYDPQVPHSPKAGLLCSRDGITSTAGCDALIVATEWPEFRDIDLHKVREVMDGDLIVDARNLLDPIKVQDAGFKYVGVGI